MINFAAESLPSPCGCKNLHQAAKTDTSTAAVIAPKQDVDALGLEREDTPSQGGVGFPSEVVQNSLEIFARGQPF